jgi:hypothetical protein
VGGKAVVAFVLGSKDLKNVVVTPISSIEIEVESPDLVAFVAEVQRTPAGNYGLPLNLVVAISDATGTFAESTNNEDGTGPEAYEALQPKVE